MAGVHRHLVFHRNGEGLGREPYRDNLLSNVYDCLKSTLLQQSCSIIRFGIQFPTDHYNDPVRVCVSVCGGGVGVGACACVCVCLRESTCVYVRAGLKWKLVPHYIFLGEVFHSSSLAIFVHERDGLSCWMLRKFQFSPRRVVPLPGRASLFEAETSVVTKTSCKNERLGQSIVQKSW